MISRDRLEELIKQEATVYYLNKNNNVISQKLNKYFKVNDTLLIYGNVPYGLLNNYYKTKEEAEWVANNWTERTEYFRPPFKLEEGESYIFYTHYEQRGIYHSCSGNYLCYCEIFDTYEEAVEYARKLFKGE